MFTRNIYCSYKIFSFSYHNLPLLFFFNLKDFFN
nr:MAG TPA: hypothetical protein [Caudoviricetes sp.]